MLQHGLASERPQCRQTHAQCLQFLPDTFALRLAANNEASAAAAPDQVRDTQKVRIGVGNGDGRPLPPNPVCGSPATGSPVSCFLIGIGTPTDGPRTS